MKRFTTQSNIKRITALLLVMISISMLFVTPVSARGGNCGNSLKWSFSYGTLTITGEGNMTNFNEYEKAPWHDLRGEIKKVVLSEGITSIGAYAFYGCSGIRAISIPNTVRTIGRNAFFECTALELVVLSSTLSRIEYQAFYGCNSLAVIDLPISLEYIGDRAFYLCESLVTITVPRYAERMGKQVFAYCISLMRAQIDAYISELPEWTFYGCNNLSHVALSQTVKSIDDYALKNCDNLTGVYHPGDSKTLTELRKDIAATNPDFASSGYIGNAIVPDSSSSTETVLNRDDKIISQTNTTVTNGENLTIVTKVDSTPGTTTTHGTYSTSVTVVVNDSSAWSDVSDAVSDALNQTNDQYSTAKKSTGTTVTVYTDDSKSVGEEFVKEMAGRDVLVEVVTPSGNVWRVDCNEIKPKDVEGSIDYNYKVSEPKKETVESLGTDDCYKVDFENSTSLKSEIMIQLPEDSAGKNAYLYQVEEDGTHKKLQAVAVDNNANAHFFLSNVEKDTEYVIGLNVPGESTEDVIITKELNDVYGAIQRLEKIEYVSTGVRNINGLTLGNLLLIVIGILVFLTIVVGSFMYFKNRQKQLESYRKYTK